MFMLYSYRTLKLITPAHDDACAGEEKKELNISEAPTFDAWTFSNIK